MNRFHKAKLISKSCLPSLLWLTSDAPGGESTFLAGFDSGKIRSVCTLLSERLLLNYGEVIYIMVHEPSLHCNKCMESSHRKCNLGGRDVISGFPFLGLDHSDKEAGG